MGAREDYWQAIEADQRAEWRQYAEEPESDNDYFEPGPACEACGEELMVRERREVIPLTLAQFNSILCSKCFQQEAPTN